MEKISAISDIPEKTTEKALILPANSQHIRSRVLRLSGEAFWVFWGQALSIIGSLIAVRILTEIMTTQSYGELALGMTAMTLLQLTVFAGTGNAAMRFFAPAIESRKFHSYLSAVWRALLRRIYAALIVVLIILGILWFTLGTIWLNLAGAAFALAMVSTATSILDGLQNAARHRKIVAWHQGIGQWLRVLAAWFLLNMLGNSSSVAMWGYAIASLLMLLSQMFFFKLRFRSFLSNSLKIEAADVRQWYDQMNKYGIPFSLWGIPYWIQIASERWALQKFAATSDVGIYVVLYQLGYYPISMLTGIVVQIITPIIFARIGDATDNTRVARGQHLIFKILFVSVMLTLILTAVTYFLHEWLFSILVASEFRSMSFLLPIMVLSGGMFASGQIISIQLMSGTESKILLAPKISTSVIATLMNFGGAYWLGVRGVIWAGFIFSLIYLFWLLLLVKRVELTQLKN